MKKAVRVAATVLASVVRASTSAVLWVFLLSTFGAASIVFGVRMLAGDAFAYIVAGVFLLLTAALVRRGLIGG